MTNPKIETVEYRSVGDFSVESMRRAGVAKNTIAINVYRLRNEHGLTQRDLADEIGTKQPNISNLESGDGNPTIDFLGRVATALNVEVTDLTDHRGGGLSRSETEGVPRRSQKKRVSGWTGDQPAELGDLIIRTLPKSTRSPGTDSDRIDEGLELSA